MERFGMSLKKARRQDAELLRLLEIESYGYKRDEKEKLDKLESEQEASRYGE